MKIQGSKGGAQVSVNRRKDGNDGVVISQRNIRADRSVYVLLSRQEWLELREHADAILGTNQLTLGQ